MIYVVRAMHRAGEGSRRIRGKALQPLCSAVRELQCTSFDVAGGPASSLPPPVASSGPGQHDTCYMLYGI